LRKTGLLPGKTALLTVLAGLLAALSAAVPARADQPHEVPAADYLTAHALVAVDGGRRINLFCMGTGSPTVLFDAGIGNTTLSWRKVQGEVAGTTRACAYDRAGYGFSDPPTGPSTAEAAVADIHALLKAAKIETPVVYVAHSIAGLYGVLLVATHPGDVAGEVLVDPSFADQVRAMTAHLPEPIVQGAVALYRNQRDHLKACAITRPPLPEDCLGHESGKGPLPPELAAMERAHVARPSYLAANASEFESFLPGDDDSPDRRALEDHPAHFGDRPLVVLTHDRITYPGMTAEQTAVAEQAWRAGHQQLAALSSRGSSRVVPGTGHHIQIEQPQAVIDAVRQVIAQLRK
jgi:pimeloyl-ACP methyl ester carboxylesterase